MEDAAEPDGFLFVSTFDAQIEEFPLPITRDDPLSVTIFPRVIVTLPLNIPLPFLSARIPSLPAYTFPSTVTGLTFICLSAINAYFMNSLISSPPLKFNFGVVNTRSVVIVVLYFCASV